MSGPWRARWRALGWGALALAAALAAPAQETASFSRALERYESRRYSEARRLFAELARERPADAEIAFYLGRLALWFDDEPGALASLERARSAAPDDARIANALGDAFGLAAQNAPILAKLGWARKCLAAYLRAVELEPRNEAFRWSLLGYFCVAPRLAGGGREKARRQADEIAHLNAMSGRVARATIALAEQRHEAAFAEFESVLREEPDNFLALYHIGRCAAVSGRNLERGIDALRRCEKLAGPDTGDLPTPACVHFRLGNLLEKKGEGDAARKEYAEARRLHPDFRGEKILLRY